MNMDHVVKLNGLVRKVIGENSKTLIIGTGRHFTHLHKKTGKIVNRNLINGKFRAA